MSTLRQALRQSNAQAAAGTGLIVSERVPGESSLEFDCYDLLPPRIREALRESCADFSAIESLEVLIEQGEEEALRMLRGAEYRRHRDGAYFGTNPPLPQSAVRRARGER